MKKENLNELFVKMAEMGKDIQYIKVEVADIKKKLEGEYVTKTEFDPVKRIVFGLVGIVLTAVVGALVGLVLLQNK